MQISLNDLLIKSSPHLPTPLPEQKSILFFDTARQFKKNYGNICKWSLRNWTNNSEQDQDQETKGPKPRPRLCKRNTQHFSLQIESLNLFIRDERQPKMNSQNFRDFFLSISGSNRLEEDSLLLTRLPGISVSMQYHFLWHFIIMLNQRVSLPRFGSVLEA